MRRRCAHMAPGLSAVTSSPPSRMRPAVGSISFSTVLPTVDLPQPDSPTRPSVSPLAIAKLTPSTALTSPTRRCSRPPWIGKCFTSSSTSQDGRCSLMARSPARARLPSRRPGGRRRHRRSGGGSARQRSVGEAAARREGAAGDGPRQRRHHAGDLLQPGPRAGGIGLDVEPRDRPHQAARVGMQRLARTAPRPAPPRPCGRHT